MAISFAQLETWSKQGAVTTSSNTYNFIRNVLEYPMSRYARREFEIYLQGSYANATNIYAESDVDIVMQLSSTFHSNKNELPYDQRVALERDYGVADYSVATFRQDVLDVLIQQFGMNNIINGKRSIKVLSGAGRRNADVVVCSEYRNYQYYHDNAHNKAILGMRIENAGEVVINYPKLHSEALTYKHQMTAKRFKPLVRVLKNIKARMIDYGYINDKTAASYFLEGWLYNAPNDLYVYDIQKSFLEVCNWLLGQNENILVMPHGVYNLIGNMNTQWRHDEYYAFKAGLVKFYDDWRS